MSECDNTQRPDDKHRKAENGHGDGNGEPTVDGGGKEAIHDWDPWNGNRTCYYCGAQGVDSAVAQCWAVPVCDACLQAEELSPDAWLRGHLYRYAKRAGRWYLEITTRGTCMDGPIGMLTEEALAAVDLSQPPTEHDVVEAHEPSEGGAAWQ